MINVVIGKIANSALLAVSALCGLMYSMPCVIRVVRTLYTLHLIRIVANCPMSSYFIYRRITTYTINCTTVPVTHENQQNLGCKPGMIA